MGSGDKDPLYLAAPQTHAQRNPKQAVQVQRQRTKLSDASKAAAALTAALNKAKAEHLQTDITKFLAAQDNQIKVIALDHGRKPSDIAKIVNNSVNYCAKCLPSIGNALVHKKGLELNGGIYVVLNVLICLNTDSSY